MYTRGIILIDILLALSLSTVFVVIIVGMSLDSRELFERAQERNQLMDVYVQHASEIHDLMPYQTWSSGNMYASARWYGNDRIETDITVMSTSSRQSIHFTLIRAYPFSALSDSQGTPLCSVDFLSGQSPQHITITPIFIPISDAIPLTHLEVRDGIAYISTDSAKSSDPDMVLVDIHDPFHATVLSSIDTGPGIVSFSLAGNRIYAAVDSTSAQLHSIRIDSVNALHLEKKYQIPLPYASATPAVGSAIFFNKNRVYLGTEKSDGDEFSIIDVSNPLSPAKLGGIAIDSKVTDVFVRDSVAYVSDSGQQQFVSVDISDPVHPHVSAFASPSGWSRQEGKVVSFFEDTVNAGRTSGGFNIVSDPELLSWVHASTTGVIPISFSSAPRSLDISGGVYGIVTDRTHVFVATRQSGKELQIFDWSLSTSTMNYYSLPFQPQSMTCDGSTLYVLGHTASVIYKINTTSLQ